MIGRLSRHARSTVRVWNEISQEVPGMAGGASQRYLDRVGRRLDFSCDPAALAPGLRMSRA
jgi:hypothetical protein